MTFQLEGLFESNLAKAIFVHDKNPSIAVAVSGGCDSVALLVLAHFWAKFHGAKIIALTVDHGIREGSELDCKFVQNLCDQLDLECHVLKWNKVNNLTSAVQSQARAARYKLMTDLCKKLDILYLCTAHHKDDSVENLFLRLQKGCGTFGLYMQQVWFWENVMIVRPLLQASKQSCRDYLQLKGISWREDPSNLSCKFARNRLRGCLKGHKSLFDPDGIFASQERIAALAPILQSHFVDLMTENVLISNLAYARVSLKAFKGNNSEIVKVLLSHILTTIRGVVPRYKALSASYCKVLAGQRIIELHGCKMAVQGDYLFIYRSFGKHPPQGQELKVNLLWDNRFLLRFPQNLDIASYFVSHLGTCRIASHAGCCEEMAKLGVANSIGEEIIASLPAIKLKSTKELVFCPNLKRLLETDNKLFEGSSIEFSPSFFSSVAHLYFCSD